MGKIINGSVDGLNSKHYILLFLLSVCVRFFQELVSLETVIEQYWEIDQLVAGARAEWSLYEELYLIALVAQTVTGTTDGEDHKELMEEPREKLITSAIDGC